jgi:putative SOS response-associated peptidase YedK
MPAIMLAEHEQIWLDPDLPLARAVELLGPYPAEDMRASVVSPRVNSWANDTPDVLEPAEPRPVTLPLF